MENLRDFLAAIERRGELERVSGVSQHLEVGGISEIVRRDRLETGLLFENLDGVDYGGRLATNVLDTALQMTIALRDEPTTDIARAVRAQKEQSAKTETRPVETVSTGPVLENVHRDDEIDITGFPAPRWREHDGGRYIGTGDAVITDHADGGDRNMGTYRVQIQGPRTATLNIEPGRDGDAHRKSYFERDEPFPVVVTLGHHPDIFLAANQRFSSDVDELEYVSAARDDPLQVLEGEVTGLPIPSESELVFEGHVYPDDDTVTEGPFGEWTGYYGKGESEQLPFTVERVYFRDDPIVLGYNNVPLAASAMSTIRSSARLWNQLEDAGMTGVQDVRTVLPGVWFQVISIEQQYPGHSTQVGLQALSLPAGVWEGRYTVIVDEDIDVYDRDQVLWAILSRTEPEEDIEFVSDCMSSKLNPRMESDKEERGEYTTSRAIVDATIPYHRKEEYPEDTVMDREFESELREKYADLFAGMES